MIVLRQTSPGYHLLGDGVRTSTRGGFVTVVGLKMADHRLVNQEHSGKTMFQGSDMYTPAVAGYVDENGLMQFFHLLVKECLKIEEQAVLCRQWKEIHGLHKGCCYR